MTRIGITGHQRLADDAAWAWVRAKINQALGAQPGPVVGVSSLAVGADQVFAQLVRERGGALEVVLPFPEYRARLGEGEEQRNYDQLHAQAQVKVLAREGRSDQEAYLRAGHEVVAGCDLLLAVWNGAPAAGLGGTGDVVQHARDKGRPIIIINPVTRTVTREGERAAAALPASLTDAELDVARGVGDPIVDPLVTEHLATHGPAGFGKLMHQLFRAPGLPEDHPLISAYLRAFGDGHVELGDPEIIARGQRLFTLFGPEVFLVLGSCSLPLAFAAGNGVQAIHRARNMKDNPVRRLYDTAQMIINVMQVGGLAPGGVGWRSACKVRLIHALIRRHVQSDHGQPWSATWGAPINQEDLAGTLLSFSVAVLHGLRRMGAKISPQDGDAYVYTWSAVGRLLGVDDSLLAGAEGDAGELALRIGTRQIRATPEGEVLAEQLLGAVATLFPLPGYANSLTHYFLADTSFGADVARVLRLPPPGWTRALVAARAWQKRQVLALLDLVPGAHRRRSFLARRFVQAMIKHKRPDDNVPFEVPEALVTGWGLRTARPAPADQR